jgi:hypothetical protein
VIRLAVMLDIRYPRSPWSVKDAPFERDIDICRETLVVEEPAWTDARH